MKLYHCSCISLLNLQHILLKGSKIAFNESILGLSLTCYKCYLDIGTMTIESVPHPSLNYYISFLLHILASYLRYIQSGVNASILDVHPLQHYYWYIHSVPSLCSTYIRRKTSCNSCNMKKIRLMNGCFIDFMVAVKGNQRGIMSFDALSCRNVIDADKDCMNVPIHFPQEFTKELTVDTLRNNQPTDHTGNSSRESLVVYTKNPDSSAYTQH